MHRIARDRIARGRPVWDRKINLADVFHNEAMTFEQRRDAVAARLRANHWLKGRDEYDNLVLLVEDLSRTETPDEFDEFWDAIYDEADCDRAWIQTR